MYIYIYIYLYLSNIYINVSVESLLGGLALCLSDHFPDRLPTLFLEVIRLRAGLKSDPFSGGLDTFRSNFSDPVFGPPPGPIPRSTDGSSGPKKGPQNGSFSS